MYHVKTVVYERRSFSSHNFRPLWMRPCLLPRILFKEQCRKSSFHSEPRTTTTRNVRSLYGCVETRPSTSNLPLIYRHRGIITNLPPDPFFSTTTSDSVLRADRPATVYQQPNHAHVIESCERLHNSVMDLNNRVSIVFID
jgi:hypothetical protein